MSGRYIIQTAVQIGSMIRSKTDNESLRPEKPLYVGRAMVILYWLLIDRRLL